MDLLDTIQTKSPTAISYLASFDKRQNKSNKTKILKLVKGFKALSLYNEVERRPDEITFKDKSYEESLKYWTDSYTLDEINECVLILYEYQHKVTKDFVYLLLIGGDNDNGSVTGSSVNSKDNLSKIEFLMTNC